MNEHSIKTAATPADAPLTGAVNAPGADLFVINLCASMTPMPSVPKHLKGFERYKLYQVSRMEDGRRRYRLRLGFFTSEADAELLVASIRSLYPAAFTGCLSSEDLRYTEGFGSRKPAIKAMQTPPFAHEKPAVAAKAAPARAPEPPVPLPAPAAAPPAASVKAPLRPPAAVPPQAAPRTNPAGEPKKPESELSLEIDLRGTAGSAAVPAPAPKAEVMPFHVARGVKVPEIVLELEPEAHTPAKSKQVQAVPQNARTPRAPQAVAPKPTAPVSAPAAPAKPAAAVHEPLPPPPRIVEDYIPVLDTTLTLRTLTQAEIDDPNQPKWYVVQLAQSEHPVNLEAMPKLDIFSAYSLYSVAVTIGGTIRHALRLGFFREDVSAEAVSGYLKTFFASPTVSRVSTAEYTRFAEPPRKPETAPGTADKVVQLKRTAMAKAASVPAQPAASTTPPTPTKNPASPYAKIAKSAHATKAAAKGRAPRSLTEQLKEEARQTLLSESGIRKAPKPQSFLSRLIGRSLD